MTHRRYQPKMDTFTTEAVDFGATDARGRRMGVKIVRCEMDAFDSVPTEDRWELVPGTWYGFRPYGTRNGRAFGPVPPVKVYATEDERDRAVADYLQGARKRAARKAKG